MTAHYTVAQLRDMIPMWEHDVRGSGPDPHDILRFLDWLHVQHGDTKIPMSGAPMTITLPVPDVPRFFTLEVFPGTKELLFRLERKGNDVVLQWRKIDQFVRVSEVP